MGKWPNDTLARGFTFKENVGKGFEVIADVAFCPLLIIGDI